jgi:hypothetical protein
LINGDPVTITPHGFFGNSPDKIFHSSDLILPEEIKILLNTARQEEVWNDIIQDATWNNRVSEHNKLLDNHFESFKIIRQVHKRFKKQICDFYNVEVLEPSPTICRWRVGDHQTPHVDKEHYPHYDIGSIIYLNDDYKGGSIYFPQHDIEISPKPGDAYAFPGDNCYQHGVREITEGVRYTLPVFWTITKHL